VGRRRIRREKEKREKKERGVHQRWWVLPSSRLPRVLRPGEKKRESDEKEKKRKRDRI